MKVDGDEGLSDALSYFRADANAAMSKAEAKAAADKAAKEAASNLSNKRFQQTQAQVDEVVDIMRMNVDKVLERDQKLSQLDDRAGKLLYRPFGFDLD